MARTRRKRNAPKGSTREKGDILEKIVADMHEIPGVMIERNIFLPTIDKSGRSREIDVLITSQVAGYPVRIAIECKNEKEPTGIAKIGEFIDKLNDIGLPVQLGIFVSTSRYESGAIERAKSVGIRMLLLQDTSKELPEAVKVAYQSRIYLQLTITNIQISNDIPSATLAGEMLFFRDESGKVCGTVADLVWKEWVSGKLTSQIGNHEVSLSLPSDWQQIVDGKVAKVSGIKVGYKVTGYAITFPGAVSKYNLVNAGDNKIEKSQMAARFSQPSGKYPIVHFKSEDELASFKSEAKGIGVFIGRFRLPRIVWYAAYWPPSQKALQKLNEKLIDSLKKGEEFDLTKISLLEIEGDDLSAMWEPIIEDHPMFSKNLPQESNNRENNHGSESLSLQELNSLIKSEDIGKFLKELSKSGNITINVGNLFSGETRIAGNAIGRDQAKEQQKEIQKRPSKKIFLAYATEDRIKVEHIFIELKQRGHLPWMDKKDLLPGQYWKGEIESQINKSDYFILCWSKNSVQKQGFIQKEIRIAIETLEQKPQGQIYFIPVKLEPCEIPTSLQFLHWVDFESEDFYEKLYAAIEFDNKK